MGHGKQRLVNLKKCAHCYSWTFHAHAATAVILNRYWRFGWSHTKEDWSTRPLCGSLTSRFGSTFWSVGFGECFEALRPEDCLNWCKSTYISRLRQDNKILQDGGCEEQGGARLFLQAEGDWVLTGCVREINPPREGKLVIALEQSFPPKGQKSKVL